MLKRRGLLTVAVALVALAVASPAPLEAASGVAANVARALRIARHADQRSSAALARAKKAEAAAAVPGPRGAVGATGADGAQGPAGATGPQGQRGGTGPAGTAVGYAAIEYCGAAVCDDFHGPGWFSPDDTNSPGIDNTANFTNPAPGVFCYRGLPFTPRVVVAGSGPSSQISIVQARPGSTEAPITECGFDPSIDPNHTAVLETRKPDAGALTEPAHDARLYVLFQ